LKECGGEQENDKHPKNDTMADFILKPKPDWYTRAKRTERNGQATCSERVPLIPIIAKELFFEVKLWGHKGMKGKPSTKGHKRNGPISQI
jgi:hypothetical protein